MNRYYFNLLILPVFVLTGFLFSVNLVSAATRVYVSQDITWTKDQSPVVLRNTQLWIRPGVTLTIEPGVVIKLDWSSSMNFDRGSLVARGTEDEPIIFTSIKDDEYGGDTNEDGDESLPASGDWLRFRFYYSSVVMDHTVVRYGGGGDKVIGVHNGVFSMDNSIVTDNAGGFIFQHDGWRPPLSFFISNSSIYSNFSSYGTFDGVDIGMRSGDAVSAINNWWGSSEGACSEVELIVPIQFWTPEYIKIICGNRPLVGVLVNFNPWLDHDPLSEQRIDPVILVPGILGSWNLGLGWELDPILNTYDNLWEALKLAGYEEGVNLFAFPYNWRLANVYSASELKSKIDEVKEICQCDKVDVVAHSMGGLVARAYIEMGNYENDIDQLIFLATPHRGSPKSYLTWEGGDFGADKFDLFRERIFKLEAELNGYGSIFDYVRKLPMKSVEELLPVYSYLKREQNSSNWQYQVYPTGYPQNLFLQLLNESTQLAKLQDIEVTNIIANSGEDSTLTDIRVVDKDFALGEWAHGYPEGYGSIFGDHGLEYGLGDGTVPASSNSGLDGFNDIVIPSSHNEVVTDAQKMVIRELTGIEPAEEVRKNSFSKVLLIRIFSPADFVVISPDGKRVGKDFVSGEVLSEIEGAFYTGFDTEMEFAVILDPLDGEYRVELQGMGDGEYTLSASLIGDEVSVDSNFTGLVTVGDLDELVVSIAGDTVSPLVLEIETMDELIEEVLEMYEANWLTGYGNMTALLARLQNQPMNGKKLDQLSKFLDNMLEKNRINRQGYDIINLALNNIYK